MHFQPASARRSCAKASCKTGGSSCSASMTASKKERSAKREAVDSAFHAQLPARPPNFADIKRDANNGPTEARLDALEHGAERFWNWFCVAFHQLAPSERFYYSGQ